MAKSLLLEIGPPHPAVFPITPQEVLQETVASNLFVDEFSYPFSTSPNGVITVPHEWGTLVGREVISEKCELTHVPDPGGFERVGSNDEGKSSAAGVEKLFLYNLAGQLIQQWQSDPIDNITKTEISYH